MRACDVISGDQIGTAERAWLIGCAIVALAAACKAPTTARPAVQNDGHCRRRGANSRCRDRSNTPFANDHMKASTSDSTRTRSGNERDDRLEKCTGIRTSGSLLPASPCHGDKSWTGSATRCRRWAGESARVRWPADMGQDARIAVAVAGGCATQADELRVPSHVRRRRHGERQRRDGSRRGRGFSKGTVVFLDLERTRRFPSDARLLSRGGWRACWPTASTSRHLYARAQCAADLQRRGGRFRAAGDTSSALLDAAARAST